MMLIEVDCDGRPQEKQRTKSPTQKILLQREGIQALPCDLQKTLFKWS